MIIIVMADKERRAPKMRLTSPVAAASQAAFARSKTFRSQYSLIAVFLIAGLVVRDQTGRLLLSNHNYDSASDVRSTLTSTASGILKRSISEHDVETGFTQSIAIKANSPIYTKKSNYQFIEVHESDHFGKVLVLDGVTQLTERDGDSYNEMMAHVPLFQHANPRRVLILGGGDGYILSEVLKHASVVHVDHVDLDQEVIETCKQFFQWGNAWNDPRVHLHIEDGAKFVEKAEPGSYDVVIQDSSDPWTSNEKGETIPLPSSSLYVPEHILNIYRALADDGILNFQVREKKGGEILASVKIIRNVETNSLFPIPQAEAMQIPNDFAGAQEWRTSALQNGFKRVRYGTVTIPTYPTGQIGFMLCEKSDKDPTNVGQRFRVMAASGMKTTYYHPRLQKR